MFDLPLRYIPETLPVAIKQMLWLTYSLSEYDMKTWLKINRIIPMIISIKGRDAHISYKYSYRLRDDNDPVINKWYSTW